jgi:signal peptidase I
VQVGGMNNVSSEPLPARKMDPELAARLTAFHEEEERKRALRAQVAKERRFLIPVFIFVVAMFPNFGRAKVVGESMVPQYRSGDALVILKTYRIFSPLKPGDIVVVRKQTGELAGEEIVKRVVFIQNEAGNAPFPQTFMTKRGVQNSAEYFPWLVQGEETVPPRGIIVVGDNADVSQDSRDPAVGVIRDAEIVGKVLNR